MRKQTTSSIINNSSVAAHDPYSVCLWGGIGVPGRDVVMLDVGALALASSAHFIQSIPTPSRASPYSWRAVYNRGHGTLRG